jgi:hypothetical protein
MSEGVGLFGQFQVAPDSAGSAGTFAALAETAKWNFSPKRTLADVSIFGAQGKGRIATLKDFDAGASGYADQLDVGLANIIASVGVAGQAQLPIWLAALDSAAKGKKGNFYLGELGFDSGDPGAASKFSAKFMFDGSPASPYTEAGIVPIAVGAVPTPAAGYSSTSSISHGTSTAYAGSETLTQIGATTSYILPTGKRLVDVATALVIYVSAAPTAIAYTVDGMAGIVTFASAPGGAVTVHSGSYWVPTPLVQVYGATSTLTFNTQTVTDMNSAGYVKRKPTDRDFKASLKAYQLAQDKPQSAVGVDIGTTGWSALVNGGAPLIYRHDPFGGGSALTVTAWVLLESAVEDVEPGKVVEQDLSMSLADQTLRGAVGNTGAALVYAGFGIGAP